MTQVEMILTQRTKAEVERKLESICEWNKSGGAGEGMMLRCISMDSHLDKYGNPMCDRCRLRQIANDYKKVLPE